MRLRYAVVCAWVLACMSVCMCMCVYTSGCVCPSVLVLFAHVCVSSVSVSACTVARFLPHAREQLHHRVDHQRTEWVHLITSKKKKYTNEEEYY